MRVRSNNASKNHPAPAAPGPQPTVQQAARGAPTVVNEVVEKLLWWFVG